MPKSAIFRKIFAFFAAMALISALGCSENSSSGPIPGEELSSGQQPGSSGAVLSSSISSSASTSEDSVGFLRFTIDDEPQLPYRINESLASFEPPGEGVLSNTLFFQGAHAITRGDSLANQILAVFVKNPVVGRNEDLGSTSLTLWPEGATEEDLFLVRNGHVELMVFAGGQVRGTLDIEMQRYGCQRPCADSDQIRVVGSFDTPYQQR